MKVDGGGTGVMTNVGRFGDKYGIGNVSATGAPFLDGADLGPFVAGGLATREPGGFEFFWQGFELASGLFDQIFDLFAPGFRVVEGVDHLLEREREL
jgi:hypothetical protein